MATGPADLRVEYADLGALVRAPSSTTWAPSTYPEELVPRAAA